MFYVAMFAILTLIAAAMLAIVLIKIIIGAVRKIKNGKFRAPHLKVMSVILAAAVALDIGLVALSQVTAYTPQIVNAYGMTPENAIAELREITLNGRKQWISIRGWDKTNPVLLFLAGGPGGTQMAAVRHELAELEKHFVVVNWDQPGSGKSYRAGRNITAETYIRDGGALTEYLKDRFSQEKIYLIGESWGSALGIFLIDRFPQNYHAFIGTGQMVDFAETERLDYAKALEIAEQRGDAGIVRRLRAYGQAPYYGKDMIWKSALYLNYLSFYMGSLPEIHNRGYNTFRDVLSEEYGLLDKFNFFRGIINTYNNVYQQLYEIDLRRDYSKLEVPVYLFLGRYDFNAPTSLAEEYYQVLEAPEKEIVWFEHSGHSPWINERDDFVREVLSCFLEE